MRFRSGNVNKLGCGLVGCGYIAEVYLEALRGLPTVRVQAACDTEAGRLAAFCYRHRLRGAFASLQDLLRVCQPNFVIIATPPATHAALCRTALEHGVAALVEKPACLSLADARALAELSVKTGVPVAVMQNYRFKPPVLKAMALHNRGELGELRRIDCIYHGGVPAKQQESWRSREQNHRLLLYEWAQHFLDIEVAFAGSVREILAVRTSQGQEGNNSLAVEALLEHSGGVTGSIDFRLFAGAESVRVELHGSRRRVVLKFYPEGFASYGGVITPLHELWGESERAARFAGNAAAAWLRPWGVSRRASSHWRFMQEFVGFLEGKQDHLPVSIAGVLPTFGVLDKLAAAIRGPREEYQERSASVVSSHAG